MGRFSRDVLVACGLASGVTAPPHEAHAGVPFALTGGHFSGQTQRTDHFA
jgi:hypothetical protein